MRLSIIIVSYNTREITRDCLQSLQDCELALTYEVIVVDNDSSDGSAEMIESEFPHAFLIKNAENLRFGGANNQAVEVAQGEYVLLLNSDTIVTSGNLERLLDFLVTNQPRVGCVGPRVLNLDGSLQTEGRSILLGPVGAILSQLKVHKWGKYVPFHEKVLPPGLVSTGRTRRVGFVSGCCMLLRRSLYSQVGGFDVEKYYFYGEEVGLCESMSAIGLETWVFPESTITHLRGASTSPADSRIYFDKMTSRIIRTVKDEGGAVPTILACMINSAGSLFWASVCGVCGRSADRVRYWSEMRRELARLRSLIPTLWR